MHVLAFFYELNKKHMWMVALIKVSFVNITLLINVIKKIFKLNGYYICIFEMLFFTKMKYQKKIMPGISIKIFGWGGKMVGRSSDSKQTIFYGWPKYFSHHPFQLTQVSSFYL